MTTTQNSSTTGAGLTQSLLPDWNTDHGGFNFGDLLILLFDGILLIYTGWRSFDLLSGTVPSGWEVMAFIGLLALDIGAVIWSYIWIFNSTTKWQDRIAMIFFVIDMSGVALTSITDSLLYGDGDGVMLAMLEPMTMVIIPIIIIANVVAGIVYHFTSAETRVRRSKRQLEAKARDESQRQQDEELQLHYAQQSLLRRQAELPRKIALANLKIAQDQLEKDAMQALFGNGDVARAMGGEVGAHAHASHMPNVDMSTLSVNRPSADASLADVQAQLEALQVLGVQVPVTAGAGVAGDGAHLPVDPSKLPPGGGLGAGTGNGSYPGGKLNPANWNLFGKNDNEDEFPESVDTTPPSPQATPLATAFNVYFRTNSPHYVIRIKTDGTDFKVINGFPEGLIFNTANPLQQEVMWIVKDELTPRANGDKEIAYTFNSFKDGKVTGSEYLEITDWSVVALDPTEAGAKK